MAGPTSGRRRGGTRASREVLYSGRPVKRTTLPPPPFVANPQRRDLLLLDCGYSVPVYPDVIEPKPARPPDICVFADILRPLSLKCVALNVHIYA